jgi:hypothetical protein
MQQQRRRSGIILGLMALGLLAGMALTAGPAQAVDAVGPYYAEPAWDRKMGVVNRFVVLTNWSSAAVLDKETGLVWERTPSGTNNFSWSAARGHCLASTTGNHKGWRLPSVHELASLVAPTQVGPALPAGHPFVIVLPIVNVHWSATTNAAGPSFATNAAGPSFAWFVNFFNGGVDAGGPKLDGQGNAWCVRGGMNADAY